MDKIKTLAIKRYMKKLTNNSIFAISLFAALISLAGNVNAQSSVTWDFSAVGRDYSLSGNITGTSNGDGSYKAISGNATFGSGYFAGAAATLFPIPTSNSTYAWAGNWFSGDKILPTTTLLDYNGINFSFNDNGKDSFIALYWNYPDNTFRALARYNDGTTYGTINIPSDLTVDPIIGGVMVPNLVGQASSFTLTQSIPEPSALSLLAIGLGGLALVRRRKQS
jgi:hypothetical protein